MAYVNQRVLNKKNEQLDNVKKLMENFESHLLLGKYKLTLTTEFLVHLENSESDFHVSKSTRDAIISLLRRITSLKVVGSDERQTGVLGLCSFSLLTSLELEKVSLITLRNLGSLRSQIRHLVLYRCSDAENFRSIFQRDSWPLLRHLGLVHCHLDRVESDLLPKSLIYLDLSWNPLFDLNVSNLSHISVLDLSFTCLKSVPKFNSNDLITSSLKTLYLRGNLIEEIAGIELLQSLKELDISYNCILAKNKLITILRSCIQLENLCLTSNPVTFNRTIFEDLLQTLPNLRIYNNAVVKSSNLAEPLAEENDLSHRPSIIEINVNSFEEPVTLSDYLSEPLLGEERERNKAKKRIKQRIAVIRDRSLEEQQQIHQTSESLNSDYQPHEVPITKTQKTASKPVTDDETEYLASAESSSIPMNNVMDFPKTPPPTPMAFDLRLLQGNVSPIATLKLRLSPITSESHASDHHTDNIISRSPQYPVSDAKRKSEDDIEVLSEGDHVPSEEVSWTEDDIQNDDNMFLVEKKVGAGGQESLFLMVHDGIIAERHCLTGKTLTTYDLKILQSTEVASDDQLTIRLTFDSRIMSKRIAEYVFDTKESLKMFRQNHLLPCLIQRKQELYLKRSFFECLKCGLNMFSENQIEKCPKCGSDAFMEIGNKLNRSRRSGSDITVLPQTPQATLFASYPYPAPEPEPLPKDATESDVWQQLVDSEEDYKPLDFDSIDHQLKLVLDVKLFSEGEEFKKCFKCRFVYKETETILQGYFVISSQRIYLFATDDDEIDKEPILNKSVTSLRLLKPLFEQAVWMEWTEDSQKEKAGKSKGRKSAQSSFNYVVMVFDDTKYYKAFINFLYELDVIVEEPREAQCPDGAQFVKYFNKEDEKWPLVLTGSEDGLQISKVIFRHSEIKFKTVDEDSITNIVAPVCISSDLTQIIINFHNEATNSSKQWVIEGYSCCNVKAILSFIKAYWEDLFAVPLLLCKVDQLTYLS